MFFFLGGCGHHGWRSRVRSFVRGGEAQLRARGMIVSRSVYTGRHPRGSCILHPLSLEVATPENKPTHSRLSSIRYATKPALQAVLSRRMQLTLHATRPNISRRFALGASNALPSQSKPDVLRPSIVGMRGSMVIRLRPCMT